MTTTTEILPPNAPAPPKISPEDNTLGEDDWAHGLKSKWPVALDLAGSSLPCRLEGEVEDLVSSLPDTFPIYHCRLTVSLGGPW